MPAALRQALQSAATLDGAALKEAYPGPTEQALGYEPTDAQSMDLIQGSPNALSAEELDRLSKDGFVISKRQEFPSFSYGYKAIYADDLPVFVSADSLLDALHRSFDALLKEPSRSR